MRLLPSGPAARTPAARGDPLHLGVGVDAAGAQVRVVGVVDCGSADRAVEVAARVPEAGLGLVEVRPILNLGGMEM
jgi:hypothetical protein